MGYCSRFVVFFYLVLLSLATFTLSVDVYFEHKCNESGGNYTANSTYQANLNRIISQFSTLTHFNYGFFNLSAGETPDNVNAIALCRGDITQHDCTSCLNYTATELHRFCPSSKAATAWSEFCLVRYANRDMYGVLENEPRTCAHNPNKTSNLDQFNQTLSELLSNLSNDAASGGPLRKYAAGNATTGNAQQVYAMAQCTPDMDKQNCTTCLNFAMNELQSCCYGSIGCRVLRPNCVLRFESNYQFYNLTAVPLPPSQQPTPAPSLSPYISPSPCSGSPLASAPSSYPPLEAPTPASSSVSSPPAPPRALSPLPSPSGSQVPSGSQTGSPNSSPAPAHSKSSATATYSSVTVLATSILFTMIFGSFVGGF